uniref:Outer membrane protein beta-barrel domain-containing protein n=1 Tax=Fervidobacterium pennivorans TaxID=93466 RepID=A0A7V4KBX7_FERPE
MGFRKHIALPELSFTSFAKLLALLILSLFIYVYAYTNSFADWYGLSYIKPSLVAQKFIDNSAHELTPFDNLVVYYSFESNANPRKPLIISSGFTLKSTVLNHLPISPIRYSVVGASYDISAKLIETLIGNMKKGIILGFSGKLGVDYETVSLLVGNSRDFDDFTTSDLKHYNTASIVNLIGSIELFVQLPMDFKHFPDMLVHVGYNIGASLFGPFTPNFEYIEGEYERAFSNLSFGLALRYKF